MKNKMLAPIHTPTATVSLKLFGAPQLLIAGQAVSLQRRQMRALLYRLAASVQPVAREQLCFLLWPDIPEATARRYLTVLINLLRQVLPRPELLLAQQDAISLDLVAVEVDTLAFARAIATASTQRRIAPVSEAVALYTGPFLAGFSMPASPEFDAWADLERQSWERRFLDALAMLVDGYAAQGRYGQAIEAAQHVLTVDELSEDMHRRLIELFAAQGDRTAALRQFERCVVVLERELGVSPLPETRAVYEAVREGRLPALKASTAVPVLSSTTRGVQALSPAAPHMLKLPAPTSPLLGRAQELAYTSTLLHDPTVRLLTLCGPGGSGKTRLAQQLAWHVAEHFADGAMFVPLAALRDPALVIQTITLVCELKNPTLAALSDFLHTKHMLLVLDNCEHVLQAVPVLAELLRNAPQMSMLATSRAALNLHGEHTFFVPPLPLPDLAAMPSLDVLANVPSVALLVARAQALNPHFQLREENAADLAAICVRLDGLPLAIELAAARLKLLHPRDLLRRLDRRLAVLTSGPRDLPDRQQTLRATIDWSYRLLDTDEQLWFERCSVFVDGWTLAAAEGLHERLRWPGQTASNPLDALAALADKSLIYASATEHGETRFDMLETIREFAAERLQERGAFEAVAQAHADYFHNLVEPWDFNAPEWLANIEHELDNLRAALHTYLSRKDGAELSLRLGTKLVRFWYWRDQISEGRRWLSQIVAQSEGVGTEPRADILNWSALFANVSGDTTSAAGFYEASLHISRQLKLLRPQANSLVGLGTLYGRTGDLSRAIICFEESLAIARQIENPNAIGNACYMLAHALVNQGVEISRGLALYEECLAVARAHGLNVVESMTLAALGEAYVMTGQLERAAELLPVALRVQRDINATMAIGWTLLYCGILHYRQANYGQAAKYLLESLEMAPHGGAQYIIPVALEAMGGVLSMRSQPEPAARLLGAAEAMRASMNHPRMPIERDLYETILASIQRQLTPAQLSTAWEAGRKQTVQQVIGEVKALYGITLST